MGVFCSPRAKIRGSVEILSFSKIVFKILIKSSIFFMNISKILHDFCCETWKLLSKMKEFENKSLIFEKSGSKNPHARCSPRKTMENSTCKMMFLFCVLYFAAFSHSDRTYRQGGGFTENLGRFLEFYVIFFSCFSESSFGLFFKFLKKFFFLENFFRFFLARAFRTRWDLHVFFSQKKGRIFWGKLFFDKSAFLLEEKVRVSICNFSGSYAAFANIPD